MDPSPLPKDATDFSHVYDKSTNNETASLEPPKQSYVLKISLYAIPIMHPAIPLLGLRTKISSRHSFV